MNRDSNFQLPRGLTLVGTLILTVVSSNLSYSNTTTDSLAEEYVHLGLLFHNHDPLQFLYTGPQQWRDTARDKDITLADIQLSLRSLRDRLTALPASGDTNQERRRQDLLARLTAMITRADILLGRVLPGFDEETRLIFGIQVQQYSEAHFRALAVELDSLIPGDGDLVQRVETFREQFVIPPGKLEAVIGAAIAECRQRTLAHFALPSNESVTINVTTDQPWVGFTEYLGDSQSVIHINRDVPIHIERAIELGCHEAYPGHHVQATLIEQELFKEREWAEYSFVPLHGPLAVIAEGAANYGIDLAFSRQERINFEKSILLPLAGIDGDQLALYYHYIDLLDALNYARNEAARHYLYEGMSREQAIEWLMTFGLETRGTASQRIDFIEALRTYVINYNFGKDLVKDYIEKRAGQNRDQRWQLFREVIATPLSPRDMGVDELRR